MKYDDIDQFIGAQPEKQAQYLQQMRRVVLDIAPDASETISYQIPAFTLHGQMLLYIAAWTSHVSLYPVPPVDDSLAMRMEPYVAGKGTLKFMLNVPLPLDLIRDVVLAHKHRVETK